MCGLGAAILYTLTNIALRDCVDVDAYLVSAVKAVPTVVLLGPLIGWFAVSGQTVVANREHIPQFIVASCGAQFLGNVSFQKALEYIGLAASVPITLGVLIVGGALFGIFLLNESVSRQKVIAMITLIVAVIVLSIPSDPPDISPIEQTDSPSLSSANHSAGAAIAKLQSPTKNRSDVLIGSFWAALSGLAYSYFGVSMRKTLQSGVSSAATMFISGVVGMLTLWTFCAATLGPTQILQTSGKQWTTMIVAGGCNFSAFIAITAALRRLPVVAVNLINASQVAMAAAAGVVVFGEPITRTLAVGIVLTILGLAILAKPARNSEPTK